MDQTDKLLAYANGMLSPEERSEISAQLDRSPHLRRELAELRAIQLAMLEAPAPVMPSARLKERVMHRIAQSTANNSVELTRQPPVTVSLWSRLLQWMPAAAVALAVVSLGMAWQAREAGQAATAELGRVGAVNDALRRDLQVSSARLGDVERQLADARTESTQIRSQLDAARGTLRESEFTVRAAQTRLGEVQREVDVLMQPNVRVASIAPQAAARQGVAAVYFAPQSKLAMLTVANLPQLKPEQTYQVWLIKGANLETRLPSVIFNTSEQGTGRVVVLSDEPFENFVAFGVTVEPAGGRPTPNPEGPIFVGKLG